MKAGWIETQLADAVTLHYGKSLAKNQRGPEGTVPVYGANGVIDWSDHRLTEGPSLVIGRKGSAGEITRVDGPFWPSDVTYYTSHDQSRLNFDFLHYALRRLNLPSMARGVKPGINRNDVYGLTIPLPPLEEQQRIAAVLDESFEGLACARAHAEANLQNARELFGTFASSLFDGLRRDNLDLPTPVSELAAQAKGSIRTGPFGSQLLHGEFVDQGIAVLGIDNAVQNRFAWGKRRFVTEEKYLQLRRYTVRPGDVVITIMGTCGRCAVIPDDIPRAINTKHLCCITLDRSKCLPEYLRWYFLRSPRALEYMNLLAPGAIMDGLNMSIIKNLPVDLPSLAVQEQIVRQLDGLENQCEALVALYRQEISNLADLRQSLLQKAFAGELT